MEGGERGGHLRLGRVLGIYNHGIFESLHSGKYIFKNWFGAILEFKKIHDQTRLCIFLKNILDIEV